MAFFTLRSIALFATTLALIQSSLGAPTDFKKQNALDAQKLNAQFEQLKSSDSCTTGDMACVEDAFAQCVGSKWVLQPCSGGTKCFALPLVNSPGTTISCDFEADSVSRMQVAGADATVDGTVSDDDDDCTSTEATQTDESQSFPITTSEASASTTAAPSPTTSATGDDEDDQDCEDDDPESETSSTAPTPTATSTSDKRASELRKRQAPISASASASSAAVLPASITSAPFGTSTTTPEVDPCSNPNGCSVDDAETVTVVVTVVSTVMVTGSVAAPTGVSATLLSSAASGSGAVPTGFSSAAVSATAFSSFVPVPSNAIPISSGAATASSVVSSVVDSSVVTSSASSVIATGFPSVSEASSVISTEFPSASSSFPVAALSTSLPVIGTPAFSTIFLNSPSPIPIIQSSATPSAISASDIPSSASVPVSVSSFNIAGSTVVSLNAISTVAPQPTVITSAFPEGIPSASAASSQIISSIPSATPSNSAITPSSVVTPTPAAVETNILPTDPAQLASMLTATI